MKALIVGLTATGLLLTAGPAFSQENDHSYGRYSQTNQRPYMEFNSHPQQRQQTNQRPYMEFNSHPQQRQQTNQQPYMEFQSK